VHRVFGEFLSRQVQRDMRDEMFASLLGKSLAFHRDFRLGDLITRVVGEARWINYLLSPGIRIIFERFVHMIVPMFAIAAISPSLLLVPLLAMAGIALGMGHYARQIAPVHAARAEQVSRLNAGLVEVLDGIETIKAHVQEDQERVRFAHDAVRYRDLDVRFGAIDAAYLPTLINWITVAVGFVHGIALYVRGAISVGDVIAYVGLLSAAWAPYSSLLSVTIRGLTAANRMLSVLNAQTETDEHAQGVDAPIRGKVDFEDVSFSYGEQPALTKVRFSVQPGETVAIVGPTGAGKTTLTQLINRIYDVGAGRVLIDDVDVRDWSLGALRSQMATVEQDVFLFSQSIAENIAFGSRGHVDHAEIQRCARLAQADEFVEHLVDGYETLVGERGVQLSGGQRQRIALARALLADPRILILDDATSAVDSETEDRIRAAIHSAREGRTMFLITHRLALIRRADRILVLRRGELIDQGTHRELLERCALYRRMFRQDGTEGASD
jgi:ATP-binding cassette subfamily B protein